MKNILKITILIIFITTINGCKKDYPKNIPSWLKTKIDKMGKRGGCLMGGTTLEIYEFKNNNNDSLLYEFSGYTDPAYTCYYDYSGNIYCEEYAGHIECYNYICNHYHISRAIWKQDPKKCK